MVVDFYFQGLNIEFHAVTFATQWHLEFTISLRRFRDRELLGPNMWDQEEAFQVVFVRGVCQFDILGKM